MTPTANYWFIVGSSGQRYEEPQWSPWSDLLTLTGRPAPVRDALVALYNATDGAYWRNRVNWLTETAPIGNWFGVSTDGDGCVVVLYLGNNGLSGQLPPELGNLANLDTLDLDGNRLTGEIPVELGNISNLTVLSSITTN